MTMATGIYIFSLAEFRMTISIVVIHFGAIKRFEIMFVGKWKYVMGSNVTTDCTKLLLQGKLWKFQLQNAEPCVKLKKRGLGYVLAMEPGNLKQTPVKNLFSRGALKFAWAIDSSTPNHGMSSIKLR